MGKWFARPRRPNGYAVIASIVLVAGAVMLSLHWASIDFRGTTLQAPAMEELAEHFAQHHRDTLHAGVAALPYRTMEQAASVLSQDLEMQRLRVFELAAAGLNFAGAEPVEAFTAPAAGHVLYTAAEGDGAPLSVFMVPNRGPLAVAPTLPMPDGSEVWIRWEGGREEQAMRGLLGSDASLIYILLSPDTVTLQAAAGRIASVVGRQW